MLFGRESVNQTGKGSLPNIIRPLLFQFRTNSDGTAHPFELWIRVLRSLLLQKPVSPTPNF